MGGGVEIYNYVNKNLDQKEAFSKEIISCCNFHFKPGTCPLAMCMRKLELINKNHGSSCPSDARMALTQTLSKSILTPLEGFLNI